MVDLKDLQLGKTYWYLSEIYSSGRQLQMKDDEGNTWTRWAPEPPRLEVLEAKYIGASRTVVYFDGLAQKRDVVVEATREVLDLPGEDLRMYFFESTGEDMWYICDGDLEEIARFFITKEEAEKEAALAVDFRY